MNKTGALNNLFTSKNDNRVPVIITAVRGLGSYTVEDGMGRSFVVSGAVGLKKRQRVIVKSGEVVATGLANKSIKRISV